MAVFGDLPYELREQIFAEVFISLIEENFTYRIDHAPLLRVNAQIYREASSVSHYRCLSARRILTRARQQDEACLRCLPP